MDKKKFYAALRKRDSGVFGTSLSQKQVNGIEEILTQGAFLSLPEMAAVLATSYLETGRKMQPVEENLNYSARRIPQVFGARRRQDVPVRELAGNPEKLANTVYGGEFGENVLGNTEPGDGWRFRGRGDVQGTGRANYEKVRALTGVDVVSHPEKMLENRVSKMALIQGMVAGIYTGKKLSDYFRNNPDPVYSDYRDARRIVNGQFMASEYAEYCQAFERALRYAGYKAVEAQKRVPVTSNVSTSDKEKKPTSWVAKLIQLIVNALKGK